ncbi:VWA domain-containing protein [Aliikangiella sp. IMCC44359]|uniref:VWA domain-containing protein n=1 Tax=Aliikangiella sp. IMCC44359 TaxID=3459125 RepID=UPI00403A92D9
MKIFKAIKSVAIFALAYSFLALNAVYGDDTEIFFAKTDNANPIKPNILFIIDTSGSMTNEVGNTGQNRIQVVKDVMSDVLTNINDVNVGLMRFNKGNPTGFNQAKGGPILYPITDIDKPADPSITKIIDVGINDASQVGVSGGVTLDANTLKFGESKDSLVAVRFNGLLVPQGAKITSAKLAFTASEGANQDASSALTISGQLSADAPELKDTDFNLSDREANVTTPVDWNINETWVNGTAYSSEDISPVVQEIVNQSGWCGGKSMVFLIKGSGMKEVYSLEGSVAASNETNYYAAPKLRITFENTLPATATGCFQNQVNAQIANKKHDWIRTSNGNNPNDWNYLRFYNSYYGARAVGISFKGINVPAGAKIKRAYLSFTSYGDATVNGNVSIKGVKLVDPNLTWYNTLRNNASIGPVNWAKKVWKDGEIAVTEDISSIIEQIVNQSGWTAGGSMSFYMKGDSDMDGVRVYSYNKSPSKSPKLHIEYESKYQPGLITKREELKNAIAELPADGYTPISDVMAEAGLYFRGEKVTYGASRHNSRTNRVSHPDSWDQTVGTIKPIAGCDEENYSASACAKEEISGEPNYVSPVKELCQSNNIVFLTDGDPTSHHTATETIYAGWSGKTCSSGSYGTECAEEIARILANPTGDKANSTPKVKTYTIGFAIDKTFLKNMADYGRGQYYTANDKAELIKHFNSTLDTIKNVSTSFVSTGVSVNQLNRLTHNEEIYYSLFSPSVSTVWPGNIKRYKLGGDGTILDKNGNPAIDQSKAKFDENAHSYWSSSKDGSNVPLGGVAEKLGYKRNVYSNITGSTNVELADAGKNNAVDNANTSITLAMLLADDNAHRTDILDWARGVDLEAKRDGNDKSHNIIGDPLHSRPTLIAYQADGSKESKLYVGTNNGFLSSFNTTDGTENWAFIPKQLLPNLKNLLKNDNSAHTYGIDGTITIHMTDENKNGYVDYKDGEKAYLYVGMRRGGTSYYALDISHPNKPKLMFTINPNTTGYDLLGQTWSTPLVGKINIGGKKNQTVLIFGGGYDTKQDDDSKASITDTVGNRVYIADALTGKLLWNSSQATLPAGAGATSVTSMNSVPSNVTAFDLDDDGLLDHIYASDTKAQIFRFDIDNKKEVITGGRIAHLQTAADIANNRRFYYQPDVALIRLKKETFISISIGSGYRAHPLDEQITDYFYMIKDKGVLAKEFDMDVSMSDLLDVTDIVGYDSKGQSIPGEKIRSTGKKGWYISFSSSGEKVIERSITFSNTVIFTSYIPPGVLRSGCNAEAGGARKYTLDIADGNPYQNNGGDDTLDKNDRFVDLLIDGIAPPPQILIPTNDSGKVDPKVCVGLQCEDAPPTPDSVMGLRWRKAQ